MKNIVVLSISMITVLSAVIAQPSKAEEDQIMGIWLTGNGKAKVEISKCGNEYCGEIVWLRDPTYEDGTPKRDKHNPEESMQHRPIMGLQLLKDFEYDDDLEWDDGTIYDAESGKTYSCVINMDEEDLNTLKVRGYIGISLIGRTDIWKRSKLE